VVVADAFGAADAVMRGVEGRSEFTSVILTYLKSIVTRGKRFVSPEGPPRAVGVTSGQPLPGRFSTVAARRSARAPKD
jgi:hypothetical protein